MCNASPVLHEFDYVHHRCCNHHEFSTKMLSGCEQGYFLRLQCTRVSPTKVILAALGELLGILPLL